MLSFDLEKIRITMHVWNLMTKPNLEQLHI